MKHKPEKYQCEQYLETGNRPEVPTAALRRPPAGKCSAEKMYLELLILTSPAKSNRPILIFYATLLFLHWPPPSPMDDSQDCDKTNDWRTGVGCPGTKSAPALLE